MGDDISWTTEEPHSLQQRKTEQKKRVYAKGCQSNQTFSLQDVRFLWYLSFDCGPCLYLKRLPRDTDEKPRINTGIIRCVTVLVGLVVSTLLIPSAAFSVFAGRLADSLAIRALIFGIGCRFRG